MQFKIWLESETPTMTLYRGDVAKVGTHSVTRGDTGALFGQGVYLTNNRRIAGDYTTKGMSDDIVFSFGPGFTKEKAIERYIWRIAQNIDADGKPTFFPLSMPALSDNPERIKRLELARQEWDEMSKDLEIRFNVDKSGVIRKKQGKQKVSEYEVPLDMVENALNAEEEIDDDAYYAICFALKTADYSCNNLPNLQEDEDGYKPTFRAVYKEVWELMANPKAQVAFRRKMKELGYTGIEYAGGVSMGGGIKHRAFVFWDEQRLKKARKAK